ncbi:TonB-dependent receptor [Luteimonas sp. Y-2-2-4F]|nr:TonB-dependent receptor [Luteimonas sp. Y-2-2-4F]MCD9032051.1 TonB-dependent receptor [Luteimonas sp. Y-2-2-4F]
MTIQTRCPRRSRLVLGVAMALGALSPAAAQEADEAPEEAARERTVPAGTPEATELSGIVVTGLKRESLLQDTPAAITSLGGTTLEAMGATQLDDFFRSVPGLQVQEGETGAGRGRMSVRGIRSQGEATLALYYGETPIIGSNGTGSDPGGRTGDLALYDVERVEVLRGPQGTLYGSSAMGGAIRILFNEPSTQGVEGSVRTELSATEGGGWNRAGSAMINTPLSDALSLRVVGSHSRTDGYVDNEFLGAEDVNGSEQSSLRAALKYEPAGSPATLRFTAIRQESETDDSALYRVALGPYRSTDPTRLAYDETFTLFSGQLNWQFDAMELVSTTAWQRSETARTVDATGTIAGSIAAPAAPCRIHFGLTAPQSCTAAQLQAYVAYAAGRSPGLFYAEMDNQVLTQETRLSSTGDGRLAWTFGSYYEDRDDRVDSYVVRADADTGRLVRPLDVTGLRYIQNDLRQWALFGEGTWAVTPALNLTAGLRYYRYDKTTSGEVLIPSGPTYQAPSPFTRTDTSEDGTVLKLGADLRVSDATLVYATASEGFRPGGTNNTPGLPDALIPYESDSLWNYEAGIKSGWLGDRVTLNLAVYRIEWDNIQVTTRTADNVFAFITNAGAAQIDGGELELGVHPSAAFSLTATLNYTDAYLTEDQVNDDSLPSSSIGRAGDRIPYVPRWSGSLSADQVWRLGAGELGLRVDYSYTGSYPNTFRPTLATYRRIGNYALVNARLAYTQGDWEFALFGRNLLDNEDATFSDGTRMVSPRPRTYGISAAYRF